MNDTKRNIFVNLYAKSGSNLASSGVGLQADQRQPSPHAALQAPSYLASHLAFFQKRVQNRGKTGASKRFVPSKIFLRFARNTSNRREKSGTNRPVLTAAGTNLRIPRGTRNAIGQLINGTGGADRNTFHGSNLLPARCILLFRFRARKPGGKSSILLLNHRWRKYLFRGREKGGRMNDIPDNGSSLPSLTRAPGRAIL